MEKRAPDVDNPFADDKYVLPLGLDHYLENCAIDHGAPKVKPAELAAGLNLPVPELYADDVQSLPDSNLFWIIMNGIRMTGMPAFSETHTDKEIWYIVTFVRRLSRITNAEREMLKPASGDMDHHHEEMDMSAEIMK